MKRKLGSLLMTKLQSVAGLWIKVSKLVERNGRMVCTSVGEVRTE